MWPEKRHDAPRKAIAPKTQASNLFFSPPPASFIQLEVVAATAKAGPNLYTFLILEMFDRVARVSSSNGRGVASINFPRCPATKSWVISGVTETLTTRRSLVESVIPNLRKDSAIC